MNEIKNEESDHESPLMTELDEYLDDVTFKQDKSDGSSNINNI
jgi:hypothetical protein